VQPLHPIVRYGRYGAVAFEFVGGILAGAVVGSWVDTWWDTGPYAVVGLTLLAVVGGFIRMVRVLRRFERRDLGRQP